jgi:hypothetical protein
MWKIFNSRVDGGLGELANGEKRIVVRKEKGRNAEGAEERHAENRRDFLI